MKISQKSDVVINRFGIRQAISALLLVVAGCSVKPVQNFSPENQTPTNGGPILIGQTVEYSGEAALNSDAPQPFSHSSSTIYLLIVEEKSRVMIRERGKSLSCLKGSEGAGPFVTIVLAEDSQVTSDSVKSPKFAVTHADFAASLEAGTFEVFVNFYANSKSCAATFQFVFEKQDDIEIGDGGETDGNTDVGDKGPIDSGGGGTGGGITAPELPFDSELFGMWTRHTSPNNSFSLQTLEISNTGKVIERLSDDGFVSLDQDLTISMRQHTNFARFEKIVRGIRIDHTEDQGKVGDIKKCIYEIENDPKTLNVSCSAAGAPNFPVNLNDGFVFIGGGAEFTARLDNLNLSIPDNDPYGISQPLTISQDVEIKDIEISIEIFHPFRGDLRVSMLNPSGHEVLLFKQPGDFNNDIFQTFTIHSGNAHGNLREFLNSSSKGDWILKVIDTADNHVGKLNSFTIKIYYYP